MWPALLLTLAIPLAQIESPPGELSGQVRQLVRQLNSRTLSERVAAEKALIGLGTGAIEFLPRITSRTPGEVRDRLGRIQAVLQELEMTEVTKATLVTLKASAMPLSEIFKVFEQQTGNRLIDHRQQFGQQVVDVTVDVGFDKTPFWQALDKLLDQASMTTYAYGGDAGAVAIVASTPDALPRSKDVAYNDIFRFAPIRIESVRQLRQAERGTLRLTLEVSWEPRINPIAVEQPFSTLKIVGDDGSVIKTAGNDAGRAPADTNPQMSSAELTIPLQLPDRSVRKIASLSGTLEAVLPGQIEEFVFENLADATDRLQSQAGVTVVLGQVSQNGDVCAVEVLVHFEDAGDSLASHRGWVFENEVHLLSPKGEKIEMGGFEKTAETPSDVGISYKFDLSSPLGDGLGDGPDDDSGGDLDGDFTDEDLEDVVDENAEPISLEGYKLVYRTPAGIVHRTFQYELKDIPLP